MRPFPQLCVCVYACAVPRWGLKFEHESVPHELSDSRGQSEVCIGVNLTCHVHSSAAWWEVERIKLL